MTTFSAAPILAGLKDFQRATVEHAFDRLYPPDGTATSGRFLVADETGLGKTMVAKGLIAKTIEHLQHQSEVRRIDIVYICSNTDIADQNLRKLAVYGDQASAPATRLTMLVAQPKLLSSSAPHGAKPVTFVSFTPGTSFEMGWQTGRAIERAILYRLIEERLELRAGKPALKRILLGTLTKLENFDRYVAQLDKDTGRVVDASGREVNCWEPSIRDEFFQMFDAHHRVATEALIEDVRSRGATRPLNEDLGARARDLIKGLRTDLARAGVHALEPDLVILDEFQRFKHLLDPTNPTAELATRLFEQESSRVLLLSATPYKLFTYSEEAVDGDDHYQDLFQTLRFIARDDQRIDAINAHFAEYRSLALSGGEVRTVRDVLQVELLDLLSRVERPANALVDSTIGSGELTPDDLVGYVSLQALASRLKAPMSVEYWKSAPYFANFIDGYKLGGEVSDALRDPRRSAEVQSLLRSTQRLSKLDVDSEATLDYGNPKLRQLAAQTVERDWWQLLWMPPSLRYHAPVGPYASQHAAGMTKRLVFSSWVAAPTAIASLLSREAYRRARDGAPAPDNFSPRLQFRVRDDGAAAAMTTLALLWPSPTLAARTDPLAIARLEADREMPADHVLKLAAERIRGLVGGDGPGASSAAVPWYSAAAIGADLRSEFAAALLADEGRAMTAAFEDPSSKEDGSGVGTLLAAHLAEARALLSGRLPDAGSRPSDLVDTMALLGVAGPGNVAWRALGRLIPAGSDVSPVGRWKAAVHLAGGFQALFNRPESTFLLDQLYAGAEDVYWRNVLRYCVEGNLQAVMDEYVHHLAAAEGLEATSDEKLFAIAAAARRALSIRGATYRGRDIDSLDNVGLGFFSRFALRYGNVKQSADDERLPEVRAAFNSPFWPFVLATTSIGQEGIDLHWWCHSVVHWNLPSNPVDFEQREGRVDRFKGHAIRKNVAASHRSQALKAGTDQVWSTMFDLAAEERPAEMDETFPYWTYPGDSRVHRHVMALPMSRDVADWTRLKEVLTLYRLAYGQPRQDDMVDLLMRRGLDTSTASALQLRLRPPTHNDVAATAPNGMLGG